MAHSSERLLSLELVHPWFYTQIAFLVPKPEGLDGDTSSFTFHHYHRIKLQSSSENESGYISCKITPIRLVIGSWCLLTLVLLNVYNGVLISYVTATHRQPALINSINDAAFDSNIRIIVNKGQGPDIVLSTATTGLYKVLGDKLRAYPMSRCNTTQQCVDLVKSLPAQHVYFSGVTALKASIKDDYQKTHQCKTTITAAETSNRAGGWGLAKKSPYLENFNRGTLELREIGLISQWEKQFEPNTKPCYSIDENKNDNNRPKNKTRQRLSLANLMGAFAVLAFGCFFSLLIFLAEMAFSHLKTISVLS
ncbi:hypothetical protein DAPPUDRAFT_104979 [Daphnia pulex]|uniref:Ionotropic glutamate receptor C-terminal domain-containing protein n=1 Tax=Daphnia pulex TaxID=6669 RepID=E9GP01_DAPPU|nr:hypothetical protein DAPPUDRAFT_104979 [Daphnia pulex]|eukprot:EFX78843.1 hypothetical protein DAPPUDRAFT_104979 [Daphnia pulex]